MVTSFQNYFVCFSNLVRLKQLVINRVSFGSEGIGLTSEYGSR